MSGMYLEDFAVGQVFRSARVKVDGHHIKSFAAEFDPQPFHLDDDAARQSIFGGLAASGWHTAALSMRLLVESDFKPAGGFIGAGVDELRWPRPVRSGDELQIEGEVPEVRPSRSKPQQGVCGRAISAERAPQHLARAGRQLPAAGGLHRQQDVAATSGGRDR